MTKTFEWNGFLVQVLADSIEIKPKTPAVSYTPQQEYPQPQAPGPGNQVYIWPPGTSLNEFASWNQLWVKRIEMSIDESTLEVECEETKSEPTDSKKDKLWIIDLESR